MNRKKRTFFGALLVLMSMLAFACGFINGNGDGPAPAPPAEVLFEDDFSDSASGWEVGVYDTGEVSYKDGAYSVVSSGGQQTMWGVANLSFDNVAIKVTATQVSAGPADNNDYGVVCREQGDGHGYYFLISGDGGYAILMAYENQFETLVDWAPSDAVNQGNATNDIEVICDGPTLTLTVNGQRLATTEDTTYSAGDIALTATSYEDAATEIHFDNLVVTRP